jgi:hypothetical protein
VLKQVEVNVLWSEELTVHEVTCALQSLLESCCGLALQYGKQREKKLSPVQVTQISQVKMEPGLPHYMEHGRVGPGLQHLDNMSGSAGIPCDNGQLGAVKGRPAQGSSALTANVPGISHHFSHNEFVL